MKKTKSQILKECRALIKDFEHLAKTREKESKDYKLSMGNRNEAFGKMIAYELAAKWLQEIVGEEKGEGG